MTTKTTKAGISMGIHRTTGLLLSSGLAALICASGCAGGQKPKTHTAGDESAGGDSGAAAGGDITGLTDRPKAPERKLSADAKVAFADAAKTYESAKKRGLKGADCREAADAFGRAADANPTLLEARFNQGAILMECGMEKDAVHAWETQTEGARKYAPSLANLGFIAWKNGDQMRAESLFNRAVEADKKNVEAHNNLAQILRDKSHRSLTPEDKQQYAKQAVEHLRTVMAVDGNNLQAYATLAFIYYELDKPELAKLVANQAIARAEELATGKFAEEQAEDFGAEAKTKGKKAGKKAKGDAAPEEQKTLKETGKTAGGGGEGYTPEMNRQIAVVWNTLGLIDLRKKNITNAIGNFRQAIDLNPQFNEARLNLAAISLKFRDYKTAEENFRSVLAAQPKNYEAVIGLGVALRGLKKIDEAEQQYVMAQKIDAGRADSYFNLGLLYQDYKGGEKPVLEKAQQYFRDFLAKASDRTPSELKEEAETRIKNIDETYKALEEAKKMMAEAEEMQRKAEAQQKEMEEKMRQQEAAEKAAGAAAAPAPAGTPAAGAPPSPPAPGGATTPPPAAEPPKEEGKKKGKKAK